VPPRPSPRSAWEQMQAVLAARRYYLDGATKSAISAELGISRFKVARLLDEAMRQGIVTVEIHAPAEVDVDQSLKIVETFGIRRALVLRLPDGPETFRREQLGRACAAILADLIDEGDVVGVAWGRTLHEMVRALPTLPASTMVQIVGSVPTSDLRVNSLDLARSMAERAHGEVFALHVPMVVDSADTATRLRQDSHVSRTVAMFDHLTKAIVSIGAWQPDQSALMAALPGALQQTLAGAGAVADICATVMDLAGDKINAGDLQGRCVAITSEQLRAVPTVIAIVGGPVRATAIGAALRSGLVHCLITDDRTATELLARGPEALRASAS